MLCLPVLTAQHINITLSTVEPLHLNPLSGRQLCYLFSARLCLEPRLATHQKTQLRAGETIFPSYTNTLIVPMFKELFVYRSGFQSTEILMLAKKSPIFISCHSPSSLHVSDQTKKSFLFSLFLLETASLLNVVCF